MIFDSLNRADTYRGISPQMDKALEVLTSTDFASLEPGRYDVNESVYFNVFTLRIWNVYVNFFTRSKFYFK